MKITGLSVAVTFTALSSLIFARSHIQEESNFLNKFFHQSGKCGTAKKISKYGKAVFYGCCKKIVLKTISIENEELLRQLEKCDNDDQHCAERDEECNKSCVSKEAYKRIVKEIIYCKLSKEQTIDEEYVDMVLSHLYEKCDGKYFELAAITASALHNTSYFTVFVGGNCEGWWHSRGWLMVTSEQSYIEMTKVTGRDYYRNPGLLECLSEEATIDMIKYWKFLVCKDHVSIIDFEAMMRILNPHEYSPNLSVEDIRRVAARKTLFEELKKELYCLYPTLY